MRWVLLMGKDVKFAFYNHLPGRLRSKAGVAEKHSSEDGVPGAVGNRPCEKFYQLAALANGLSCGRFLRTQNFEHGPGDNFRWTSARFLLEHDLYKLAKDISVAALPVRRQGSNGELGLGCQLFR